MSARDDYPAPTDRDQWVQMCVEIDRLRAEVALLRPESNMVIFALNDLVGELTKHADALRAQLIDLMSLSWDNRSADHAAIDAYDEFIKEC